MSKHQEIIQFNPSIEYDDSRPAIAILQEENTGEYQIYAVSKEGDTKPISNTTKCLPLALQMAALLMAEYGIYAKWTINE